MQPTTIRNFFLVLFLFFAALGALFFVVSGSGLSAQLPAPLPTETSSPPAAVQDTNGDGQIDPTAIPEAHLLAPTAEPHGQASAPSEQPAENNTGNFALMGSLAASAASLIGFLTTTLITWRKEKREADLADVERKNLEIELEKNKLELEELKRERKKR